jgi:hypothetical protein
MSTTTTTTECLERMLFGSPANKLRDMQKHINQKSTALFLLNFERDELQGVFAANGLPQIDIEPDAWKKNAKGRTFPAQIRVQQMPGSRLVKFTKKEREVLRVRGGACDATVTRALLTKLYGGFSDQQSMDLVMNMSQHNNSAQKRGQTTNVQHVHPLEQTWDAPPAQEQTWDAPPAQSTHFSPIKNVRSLDNSKNKGGIKTNSKKGTIRKKIIPQAQHAESIQKESIQKASGNLPVAPAAPPPPPANTWASRLNTARGINREDQERLEIDALAQALHLSLEGASKEGASKEGAKGEQDASISTGGRGTSSAPSGQCSTGQWAVPSEGSVSSGGYNNGYGGGYATSAIAGSRDGYRGGCTSYRDGSVTGLSGAAAGVTGATGATAPSVREHLTEEAMAHDARGCATLPTALLTEEEALVRVLAESARTAEEEEKRRQEEERRRREGEERRRRSAHRGEVVEPMPVSVPMSVSVPMPVSVPMSVPMSVSVLVPLGPLGAVMAERTTGGGVIVAEIGTLSNGSIPSALAGRVPLSSLLLSIDGVEVSGDGWDLDKVLLIAPHPVY